jgi:hypothetical protein
MSHGARYVITYVGSGIMRLPRAGIFQTGTRAVVDEVVARIAAAHESFTVVPLADAVPIGLPVEVIPPEPPAPVAAAPVPPRRPTRKSAAVRIPD